MDICSYIGKRCLLKIGIRSSAIEEFHILEMSPSGKFVKFRNQFSGEFWREKDEITFVEELPDLEIEDKIANEMENIANPPQVIITAPEKLSMILPKQLEEDKKSTFTHEGIVLRDNDMLKLEKAFFRNLQRDNKWYGAIGIDCKHPFGNSDVEYDILELIGAKPEGDGSESGCWSSKQRTYAATMYSGLICWLQAKYT